jgi:hypothetical protein
VVNNYEYSSKQLANSCGYSCKSSANSLCLLGVQQNHITIMKVAMQTLAGLLAVALAIPATAQDTRSRSVEQSDPTYSTRNYKHPNKAAAAQQWEPEASIEFRQRKRRFPQSIASYREEQRRGGMPNSAIAVPASPTLVNRNYKQQNQPVNRTPVAKQATGKQELADNSEY